MEEKAKQAERVYSVLANAFVFAEKIIDGTYQDAVMKRFLETYSTSGFTTGPECATIIYEGTLPGCSARRFLVDCVAYVAHDDSHAPVGWMTMIGNYPHEMLAEALKLMTKIRCVRQGIEFPYRGQPDSYLLKSKGSQE